MPGSPNSAVEETASRRRPRLSVHRPARAVLSGAALTALLMPLLGTAPSADAGEPQPNALQKAFAVASERYQVPQSVLLGVSYLQSRWDAHNGRPSVSGGYGPMHLTDARTALARSGQTPDGAVTRAAHNGELPSRLRTLERAAKLTGLPAKELRESPAANVQGGAALLAAAQKKQGRPLGADPADWFGAVAAYPGGSGEATEAAFAHDVYDLLRTGRQRTTDAGQRVALPADRQLRPEEKQVEPAAAKTGAAECPSSVSCEWLPSPYKKFKNDEGEDDYGNHDRTHRPDSQDIDYIVVHDTEETWEKTLDLVRDPAYVSWNYTLRSSDGHIAQHVRNKDVAWHAGNWYVNSKSVGLEHEGFLTDPDAWFTEAMYLSSARLVRHLSEKYDIPLDRRHIVGHDNVPGTTTSAIKGMHTDPGPYWDWDHYFALLGEPFTPEAGADSGVVTIRPDYNANRPEYSKCDDSGDLCPAHGSGAVRLHTEPDAGSPLVTDAGLHPDGGPSTIDVNDTGARASTGQQYAVAGRKGEWSAIWYLGKKAWFHNPEERPTAVPGEGDTVEPKKGKKEIPVYGRAYPEESAYPEGVPVQKLSPLPYTVKAGQRYVASAETGSEYLYATDYDPEAENYVVVRGKTRYYPIQLGHRLAYVKADDVRSAG